MTQISCSEANNLVWRVLNREMIFSQHKFMDLHFKTKHIYIQLLTLQMLLQWKKLAWNSVTGLTNMPSKTAEE